MTNLGDLIRHVVDLPPGTIISPGYANIAVSITFVIIFLSLILGLAANYHKRRGHFTHPTATKDDMVHDIVHLINSYLHELYCKPELAHAILDKNHDRRKLGNLSGPGLHPNNVKLIKAGMLTTTVWKFNLPRIEDVAYGSFGNININNYFFTVRTSHHRYAMNIAAQLFYFQAMALSGQDPRKIQHKNKHIKKAGDIVLAKAGKLQDSASLNERAVVNTARHDRKIDDQIAGVLALTEKDTAHIEAEMKTHVRSIHDLNKHDILKGGFNTHISEADRFASWIKQEIHHLQSLLKLMHDKKIVINRFLKEQKMTKEDRQKFEDFIPRWEREMIYVQSIIDALEKIQARKADWSFSVMRDFTWTRKRNISLGDAANKLHEEGSDDNKKILIHRVQALITSFTAERGRILQLMQMEEAAA